MLIEPYFIFSRTRCGVQFPTGVTYEEFYADQLKIGKKQQGSGLVGYRRGHPREGVTAVTQTGDKRHGSYYTGYLRMRRWTLFLQSKTKKG
jgi:hypothetical protein